MQPVPRVKYGLRYESDRVAAVRITMLEPLELNPGSVRVELDVGPLTVECCKRQDLTTAVDVHNAG
jgi:hypothetical protein